MVCRDDRFVVRHWLPISAALFAAITAVRLPTASVGDGTGFLYILPICIVGMAIGWHGAIAASAVANGLIFAWAEIHDLDLPALGHGVRFAAIAVVGVLVSGIERERAELLERLHALAHTDDLTGLANRRAWEDQLDRALAHSGRTGLPVAIGLIDLDGFKAYNDRHGHPAGDRLLHAAASAWSAQIRASDLLARHGGDEFALILSGCDEAAAVELAERIRAATPVGATCCVGIVAWDGAERPEEAVRRADAALYRAKADGRDRVRRGAPATPPAGFQPATSRS